MEVLEAIAAVNSVAKLAYLLGSAIYDITHLAYNSKKIPRQLQLEINSFQGFINLVTTVELSIKHRCPQNEDSPVISYMKTQGVLHQLQTECKQLTDAIVCQQNEISTYRAKLGPDPNFGRRVVTAIIWKTTLGPKTYNLHPMIERLKTSLHLVMNIIHLEAVQQSGLQEEITRLKDEIRRLRHRLPHIAYHGGAQDSLAQRTHAHHLYLTSNNTVNSFRQSFASLSSTTSITTMRGSQVDTDNLSILAESMVETGHVPAVSPGSSRILMNRDSDLRVRTSNSLSTIRSYTSDNTILTYELPRPRVNPEVIPPTNPQRTQPLLVSGHHQENNPESSYSLPEDRTPVTIKTHNRRTPVLIEYFEGGKGAPSGDERKPSVRVRLTPSHKSNRKSSGSDRGRIEITEAKSTRRSSQSRRADRHSQNALTRGENELMSVLSGSQK